MMYFWPPMLSLDAEKINLLVNSKMLQILYHRPWEAIWNQSGRYDSKDEIKYKLKYNCAHPFGSSDSHMNVAGCSQGVAENRFSKIEAQPPALFAGWSAAQFRAEAAMSPSHWKLSSDFLSDVKMGVSKSAAQKIGLHSILCVYFTLLLVPLKKSSTEFDSAGCSNEARFIPLSLQILLASS